MPTRATANRERGSASLTHAAPAEDVPRAPDPFAEIVALARAGGSRHAFFRGALGCIGRALGCPYAAAYVRDAAQVIQEDFHAGSTDPSFFKAGLQNFLTESLAEQSARARLLNPKRGTTKAAFLSAPVVNGGGATIGAIACVVYSTTDADVPQRLALLDAMTRLASYAAELHGAGERRREQSAAPNDALARAGNVATAEQLAFRLTNTLRAKLGCEQVALGLAVHRRVKVLSISGLDHVAAQSTGVVHLRAAMEECLDADRVIVCQSDDAWASERLSTGHRLHYQWRAASKGDGVASIPLRIDDNVVAVLSLRMRVDQPLTGQRIDEIRKRIEPFAPALLMARRAGRGLARHAVDSVLETARLFTTPGRRGFKIAVATAVAALGWFLFGSMGYQLTVPCTVAPAVVRHVTTPFDGVLAAAEVIQGDRVQAGDVLCRLDATELDHQRAELLAQIAVLERTRDQAMAANEPVNVQLALANQRLAQAKLDIVEDRIRRATVVAPIDGMVVAGDLRKLVGGVVGKGAPLFEIAPLDSWRVELEVPAPDADDLAVGLVGHFAPQARPEQGRPLAINRVHPAAVVRGGRTVYVAEAEADLPLPWLRAGMAGMARIDVGRRPVWWVASHRLVDYVRLHFWL